MPRWGRKQKNMLAWIVAMLEKEVVKIFENLDRILLTGRATFAETFFVIKKRIISLPPNMLAMCNKFLPS
uniref:Uncharacterized protein n=1 Tax=Romanomermis culicivorax TaxID=13658 RepID=A0A915KBK3_ROMCU